MGLNRDWLAPLERAHSRWLRERGEGSTDRRLGRSASTKVRKARLQKTLQGMRAGAFPAPWKGSIVSYETRDVKICPYSPETPVEYIVVTHPSGARITAPLWALDKQWD